MLLATLLPVAIPGLGAHAAARTPPFPAPAEWSTLCGTQRGSGTRLREGVNCRWLRLDGVYRRYVVVVPRAPSVHPAGGWPLVLMLHGRGGYGEKMMRITEWIAVGKQSDVITVFPTSWRYHYLNGKDMTRWNTPLMAGNVDESVRLDGYPADKPFPTRDIEFLRRIINDVRQAAVVDPRHIHVTGSSNGGQFVSRVVVEMGDVVASVSCSGFCDAPPEGDRGGITRPVPMLFGLGTRNSGILQILAETTDPDPTEIPLAWNDAGPLVAPLVAGYLDTWQLDATPTSVTERSDTTVATWRTPRPDAEAGGFYRLLLLEGARHLYASPGNNPRHLSLARFSWEFFRNHPMP